MRVLLFHISLRYFAAEECDNVAISYPYNATSAPVQQPTAHGDHPHLGGGGSRRSIEESLAVHRSCSPALPGDTRMLSSHYVEEMVEKVLAEQQLQEKFNPTVLIAVCDDSVAPARMLCHHLRYAFTRRIVCSLQQSAAGACSSAWNAAPHCAEYLCVPAMCSVATWCSCCFPGMSRDA